MKDKVKNYINKMTKDDIINFAKKNNTSLTNDELNYIYNKLKTSFDSIYNNPKTFMNDLKRVLDNKNYQIVETYYKKYSIYL